jgi:hypothetical protein
VEGVLWYRPERHFLVAFSICFLVAILLAAFPTEFYLRERRLEEGMIYRFIVCFLLGTAGFVLLSAGTLAHCFVVTTDQRGTTPRFWPSQFEKLFTGWTLGAFVLIAVVGSFALVWPGLLEYAQTRHTTLHWSRVMVAAFGLLVAFIAVVTATLLQVLKVRNRHSEPASMAVDRRSVHSITKSGPVLTGVK